MLKKIFTSLFIIFILDLVLLIKFGSLVGASNTVLYLLIMVLFGIFLVKFVGWELLGQIQSLFVGGQLDQQNISQKLYYYLAAILLIIPGLLSDILALLIIWPLSRKIIVNYYLGKRRDILASQRKEVKIINIK
ncbi:MAG: hypothetical protein COX77_05080 [Candidatus Komeilibacteria bacterium CG_4_10_14_0_2_um_filter_37_10]|uniref:FxsA protein n=1 Tax=Candidatus Komeilibacteria bacterium CG_4_10_14_0_2_um_filter_37_10 TaxID=1974470 RepID=A0A2M7VD21_9BACT|nr:MAG: hypothetical protein COX77_05080 [Candidatus Komeilibacteria bacterium CG_4_10_14_0_2_um_filter_37_10]